MLALGDLALFAVEDLVLDEDHRVVGADGALEQPLGVGGVAGRITVRPGMWAYQASSRCEWVAARQPAIPELPRKTIGTANWPPLM